MSLIIYSKERCVYCDQAKRLLTGKGITYTEIKIDEDKAAHQFLTSQGHTTVPQLYKDGKLLVEGGYSGLALKDKEFFNQLKGNNGQD